MQNGIQRYKCNVCNKSFSSNRRPKKSSEILFYKYVFKHQTYADLASEYSKSKRWVSYQIHKYIVPKKEHKPRAVTLVCDTTFYGKRKDKLATVFFYDVIADEILLWKHVESERCQHYRDMLSELLVFGYMINSVTMDGKRGLNTVFKDYPIQICHFHQKQTVQRYITKKPKLQASKDLQVIMRSLTKVSEKTFKQKLDNCHNKYEDFLAEYTVNKDTGEVVYTHKKVRSAYASLCSNFDYLFTYKKTQRI